MADTLPPCPACSSEYTYEMGALLVCPECAHEWNPDEAAESFGMTDGVVKDAMGNVLADGDTVTVEKHLCANAVAAPVGSVHDNTHEVSVDHSATINIKKN